MSEEAASGNSVVVDDSTVSLSKGVCEAMMRTISVQKQKIQAFKNLHQLVQSKDEELRSTREKAQNLQAALDRAETRLANQIRLAAASKTSPRRSSLEADSAACGNVAGRERVAADGDRPGRPDPDIEMDGACPVRQSSRFHAVPHPSSKPPSPSFPSDKSDIFVKSPTVLSQFDSTQCSDKNTALQSTPQKKNSVSSIQSVRNGDVLTSMDVTEKVSLPENSTLKSISAAGDISKDLLDKLMHQNARLRKVIKDILAQRGSTLESHLERHETQDVVNQLREELRLSKQKIERLRQTINTKDEDDLLKKFTEQGENFQKAKKTISMLQTMVDAYGKEYEKLQEENKLLRERLSTSAAKQKPENDETKEHSGKPQSVVVEHGTGGSSSKLPYDQASGKLESSKTECENLRTQCQELQDTLARHEKDTLNAEQLDRQCAALESEKQLLESQIVVFQEDFAAEHKEYSLKQQQYEGTLAKHQDWIRRLVAEAQKSRSSLEEERARRTAAETSHRDIEDRFRKFILDSRSNPASCRNAENLAVQRHRHDDLQVDNVPEASGSRAGPGDPGAEVDGALVCPRCEREFDRKDEQRFRDHTDRCTDD